MKPTKDNGLLAEKFNFLVLVRYPWFAYFNKVIYT
jgi:hypothetical protein